MSGGAFAAWRAGLQAADQMDSQLASTITFSVALQSVNAMNPVDRGLQFIATIAVALVIAKEAQATLGQVEKPKGLEAAFETGQYLLEVAAQLLSSVFAAASGTYITEVVGNDASTRPVYTLLLSTTIIGLLFLGRRALERK